jgi:hypothetical protein
MSNSNTEPLYCDSCVTNAFRHGRVGSMTCLNAGAEDLERGDARLSFSQLARARKPHGEICLIIPKSLWGRQLKGLGFGQDVSQASPLPLVRRQLMSMSFIPRDLRPGVVAQL